jgi:hypothetical protein
MMELTPNLPKDFGKCAFFLIPRWTGIIASTTTVEVDIISTSMIIRITHVAEMARGLGPSTTWDIILDGSLIRRSELDLQGSESGVYNHFF